MLSLIAALVLAPLLFALLGAPLALVFAPQRPHRFVLLCGCFTAGFLSEAALVLRLPTWPLLGAAAVAGLVLSVRRWPRRMSGAPGELGLAWGAAVVAMAVSPFPVLGSWSGDWLQAFEQGRAVLDGSFGPQHLARPPLFGAAMGPLWFVERGLPALQCTAAVASAGAALAVLELAESLYRRPPLVRSALLPLLASTFFLHHTAAAWSKLMVGGLIALSWAQLVREGGSNRERTAAAALFAMAIATHDGALVWAPLTVLLAAPRRVLKHWIAEGARLAIAVVVIAGPFMWWTLWKFGLAARIAANPAITDRSSDPFLVKASLVTVSTFVGWSPIEVLYRWLSGPTPFSSSVAGKELYWLATSLVTIMAATAAGVVLPFLISGGARRLESPLRPFRERRAEWLLGICVATLAMGALSPFHSADGTLQTMHAPIVLLAFAVMGEAVAGEQGAFRRWMVATLGLCTVPWFALNAGVSAGLRFSPAFEERFRAGSEGDYARVLTHGLSAVGVSSFPVLAVAVLFALWAGLRRARKPSMN